MEHAISVPRLQQQSEEEAATMEEGINYAQHTPILADGGRFLAR